MKTLFALAVAASLLVSTTVAHADNLMDVRVIDRDTGAALPTYAKNGKLYIVGTPGHRYGVRLTNRSGTRVLAVLSVDGVNAVTGETASPQQTGYVIGPYATGEINGWRKSASEIAQFNFTALSNSYAARTGRPNNVGVIGLAVFREKQAQVWFERHKDSDNRATSQQPPPAPAPTVAKQKMPNQRSAASSTSRVSADVAQNAPAPAQAEESLGTGHGARESSYASRTSFERESDQPNEVISIWYDSNRNLVAQGVIPTPRPIARQADPFPNHFVPDPAG